MKLKKFTVDEVFQMVWREHWSSSRFQLSGHARQVQLNYDNHIKDTFAKVQIASLTRSMVREWHSKLLEIPITANRSLETLSKLCSYAVDRDLAPFNPCAKIKVHREKRRKRYATEQELKKLGAVLDKYAKDRPVQIAFIYTLLFTGARPRSIERANWQDVSFLDNGFAALTFDGKSTETTGEEEVVILPPQVVELIKTLPRRMDGLIFGIKIPRKTWYRVRTEAGCPDLWARDLRRTFATVGFSNGVNMDVISELLNHKSTQTTKIYAKLMDDKRVKAVKEITTKMNAFLQGNGSLKTEIV